MALVPTEPRQRKALGAIIGAVAVAGLFWNFWLTGQKETLVAEEERLETLSLRNQQAQMMAVRGGADLEENLATFERHVRRLEELVPAAEEVPQLIVDVNTVARELGVEQLNLSPGPAEPGTAYTRRTYDTQWVGDYHSVGAFLARIASLQRIMTPIEFALEPYNGNATYPNMVAPVVVTFTLETFALPDADELAARAAAQAAATGGGQ